MGDAASSAQGTLQRALEAQLADGSLELPVLPEVTAKVLALVDDPQTSAGQLSDLIHRDPALAANVMKLVASPIYSGATAIVSLQQAIARLGMRTLRELVLAAGVQATAFRAPVEAERVREVWKRSLVTALVAKEVARCGRRNVETAFLCGLLHEIGTPVVLQAAGEQLKQLGVAPAQVDFNTLIDTLSCAFGEALTAAWGMPEPVTLSVQFHTDFEKAPQHMDAVAVTTAAIALCNVFLAQDETAEDAEQVLREHPVLEHLNLYPDDVDDLLSRRDPVVESAASLA